MLNNRVDVLVTVNAESQLQPIVITHSNVEVSPANTILLPENPNRKYVLIANNSDVDVYISFGVDAAIGSGVPINAGGSYEMSANYISNSQINAISEGSGVLLVTEGVQNAM